MGIKIRILQCVLVVLAHSTFAQINELDRDEIGKVVDQFYTIVSFKNGEWKNAEDLKELFFADSRLVANFGDVPQVWTIDEYIASVRGKITRLGINEIEEKEIYEKTDLFGKVAQRLSTYQIRSLMTNGKEAFRTGINLIQLIKVNGLWKINSISWDRESDQLKIPSQYMPADQTPDRGREK